MRELRITESMERVLGAFLQAPEQGIYGYDLMKAADLSSGVVYPILVRLEAGGWIQSRWEQPDLGIEGRPRRRRYELTTDGRELAEARQLLRKRVTRPALSPLPELGIA